MTINNYTPSDSSERDQALDPSRSFIVQAPAGSGKTGLLVQRYLRLLSLVQAPEEILAITFTRKAAAEMRSRILGALRLAKQGPGPDDAYTEKIRELAARALEHDCRMDWCLEQNPSRLKIRTIDSLCASLVGQMPLLSKLGFDPVITQNPETLYREAARQTAAELETEEGWSEAVAALVGYLDNNLERVVDLVSGMLARREQWLRHLADRNDARLQRQVLEQGFLNVVKEGLDRVRAAFAGIEGEPVLEVARFAASRIEPSESDSPIKGLSGLSRMPGSDPADLQIWLGLAGLFLTAQGTWRKQANKNIGFPAPGSTKDKAKKEHFAQKKEEFQTVLAELSSRPGLRQALHELRTLPPPAYSDEQWAILQSLFEILPLAVAHLHLVFQTRSEVDFAEVSLRAGQALGALDDPTDLGLAWDSRIAHILMDEFQDTNQSQYALLLQLTAGWQDGDGRTFFAVGDPMQSIYLFREAEVGLFLQSRRYGLGELRLTPLQLRVNFRSQKQIVDWVNETFARVLPGEESITRGKVPFARSEPWQPEDPGNRVRIHPFFNHDPDAEARSVLDLIEQIRARDRSGTIGVLVRSRSHLRKILPTLREHGVSFQAVEIETLAERPVVQDLLALTKALIFPGHRLAWLAVLRAGWSGLDLADLQALAGHDFEKPVLHSLFDQKRVARLSPEGRQRVYRVREVLHKGWANRMRGSLRDQVEAVWLELGGAAAVSGKQDLEDARLFFDLLSRRFSGLDPFEPSDLDQSLKELFAQPEADRDAGLQVMTIHKAKGLEFDTVILPGLGRTWPADPHQLLLWLERPNGRGSTDLLLAPMAETGADQGQGYRYLKGLKKQKSDHEEGRVLYVAATRAVKELHLLGHVTVDEKTKSLREPAGNSPLSCLWPAVEEIFCRAFAEPGETAGQPGEEPRKEGGIHSLCRLSLDWSLPPPPKGIELPGDNGDGLEPEAEIAPVEYVWVGRLLPRVGTLVHRWLLRLAGEEQPDPDAQQLRQRKGVFRRQLLSLGVSPEEAKQGAEMVLEALEKTLADPRGRWILANQCEARSEYALTALIKGKKQSVVMDRTFVDESGVRWIIDYKTSTHAGSDPGEFLDREQARYREQMEAYARIMRIREDRPLRLGLYFPLLQGWREWGD
ncbi:MAG: UvrD-helicase domain-containing protein [Desulfohalobiaceae bacterium]|nr:UvrD-helicase domain-containing protein [Desulfohalobiaceae bacterium]